jgi:hypothetical protein
MNAQIVKSFKAQEEAGGEEEAGGGEESLINFQK